MRAQYTEGMRVQNTLACRSADMAEGKLSGADAFAKQETRLQSSMKDLACEAQGFELDWKNDREPLNNVHQGHDMKEEGKTRERRPVGDYCSNWGNK